MYGSSQNFFESFWNHHQQHTGTVQPSGVARWKFQHPRPPPVKKNLVTTLLLFKKFSKIFIDWRFDNTDLALWEKKTGHTVTVLCRNCFDANALLSITSSCFVIRSPKLRLNKLFNRRHIFLLLAHCACRSVATLRMHLAHPFAASVIRRKYSS